MRDLRRPIVLVALMVGLTAAVQAGTLLSEEEANHKAVDFIRGDTYGVSPFGIGSHLKRGAMVTTGANDCGPVKAPLWAFHFQTKLGDAPIDGWLHIDAATGDVECSSIPFLR